MSAVHFADIYFHIHLHKGPLFSPYRGAIQEGKIQVSYLDKV